MKDDRELTSSGDEAAFAAVMRAAQGDVLTDEAAERVRKRVAATVAVAGAGVAVAAAKPCFLLGLSSRVWMASTVAVALAGGGLLLAFGAGRTADPSPPEPALVTPSAPTSPPPVPPAVTPAASSTSTASAPSAAPAASPPRASRPALPQRHRPAVPANEGALLLEARSVLETDPARALALVRAHEKQFPDSALAPERGRLAAEATQRLECK
jgi:hypothetical protein